MYEVLIDRPRFKNKCKKCLFLGQFGINDLYFCGQENMLLAANRNGGGTNETMLYLNHKESPKNALTTEARRRAITKGLMT